MLPSKGASKLITLFVSTLLIIGLVVPLATSLQHPKVTTEVHTDVKALKFIPPKYEFKKIPKYKELYRSYSNLKKNLHYLGTLVCGHGLMISVYRDLNSLTAIIIYHTVDGRVLKYLSEKLKLVKEKSTSNYAYKVYEILIPNVKLSDRELSASLESVTKEVVIWEAHVEGIVVYNFGVWGSYKVHLKGIVWIKDEGSGSKVIVDAVEKGSYAERIRALKYLFSQCWFKAWAQHNQFKAFIKGDWGIAENTAPYTYRCSGRPVLSVDPNINLNIDAGGPNCGGALGSACYGWSPSLSLHVNSSNT